MPSTIHCHIHAKVTMTFHWFSFLAYSAGQNTSCQWNVQNMCGGWEFSQWVLKKENGHIFEYSNMVLMNTFYVTLHNLPWPDSLC